MLCFALEQPLPALARRVLARARLRRLLGAHARRRGGASTAPIDAVGVKLWDLAAIQPIVEEAGGRFSDRDGVARADGGTAISSNGLLHDALLAG